MPYIKGNRRFDILRASSTEGQVVVVKDIQTPGELNFAITSLLKAYIEKAGTNYHTLNDVVGVLEAAKLEFYRRVVGPYEDQKILENGDVY